MSEIDLSLIVKLILGGAIWAEVIGVPFAWLKLRNTSVWSDRPEGVRRIELLATFVARVTALGALLGGIVACGAILADSL